MDGLQITKLLFEASGIGTYPVGFAQSAELAPGARVQMVIVLPGVGEVIEKKSLKGVMDSPFFYVDSKNYSLFGASCLWPIVFCVVQTSEKSAYRNGEIPYAVKMAKEHYNCIPGFAGIFISLGGYGALQWFNTYARAYEFDTMLFDMPGGNGDVGAQFPSAAVGAGVNCLFVHAQDDTTAKPAQSIKMNKGIKDLGGISNLVMYEKGGHGIMTRPFNAYYDKTFPGAPYGPTTMVNDTNMKVIAGSYIPQVSIYGWFMNVNVPAKDKLIFTGQIWQKADGSYYTKNL